MAVMHTLLASYSKQRFSLDEHKKVALFVVARTDNCGSRLVANVDHRRGAW